jgi:cell division protein FtsW
MTALRPDHGTGSPVPDTLMFGLWVGLLLVGAVAVTSASMELAASRYGDAEYHLIRHGIYMVLSTAVFALVLSLPTTAWAAVCRLAWPLTLLLLILVLVPGLGREVNGSMRWIGLGPASIQPSELAKFLLVIHLAGYLQRHAGELPRSFAAMAWPFVWLLPPALLLLMEPDLGSAVVIFGAAAGLVLLAGARVLHLLLLASAATASLALLVLAQPYRLQRLEGFLDPWAEGVQFGSGYQLTQALIAFGRGEWFGVGLGEGLQKLFYLPEAHTDFIFAVIAEETGVVGALCLCAALVWLVLRGLAHGRTAEVRGDRFAAMLAYGAALMLAVQMLVSLGVNTGLLPTKGLTLPLVSYGGNSLLVSSALVALMMRVDWENRLAAHVVPATRSQPRSAEVAA